VVKTERVTWLSGGKDCATDITCVSDNGTIADCILKSLWLLKEILIVMAYLAYYNNP